MTWPTDNEQNEQPTHYDIPAGAYPSQTWPMNQDDTPVWPDNNSRQIGAPPPPPPLPPYLATSSVPSQFPLGYLIGAFLIILALVIPTTARLSSGRWFWEGGSGNGSPLSIANQTTKTATSVPSTATPMPPTATVGPTKCSDVSGFTATTALTTNSDTFSEVSFPPNSVGSVTGDSEQSGYQIRTIATCSPNIKVGDLTSNYDKLLTDRNWQQATSNSPGCTPPACWQRQDDTGAKLTFAIDQLQQQGQVATYNILLAISPLGSGNASLGLLSLTYSADNDKTDLRWQLNGQIKTSGAALVAILPSANYPVSQFSTLSFSGGQFTPKDGQAIGLKTNGGHFARLIITSYTSTAIKFQWTVYGTTF